MKRSATATVTAFEFHNYIARKSFIITTLVMILSIGLFLNLPSILMLLQDEEPAEKKTILVIDETRLLQDPTPFREELPSYNVLSQNPMSDADYRAKALDPKIFGVFVIREPTVYEWITDRQHFGNEIDQKLRRIASLEFKERVLAQRGVARADIDFALADCDLTVTELSEEAGKSQMQTMPYTMVLIFALYMFVLTYGQMTATSVASEKSTRAMEILITSTEPAHLIYGKVFGTGLAGLFQVAAMGAAYYFFSSLSRLTGSVEVQFLTESLKMPVKTFVMAVVIFILTYLAFAFLFGALGSLVKTSEEVSQVITPVSSVLILVFLLTIMSVYNPDTLWVTILSFVPLVGPLVYFVRYAMLDIPLWQDIIILAIHVATVFGCARIATTIYENGVLNYGKVPKTKELFRLLKKETAEADN